MIHKTIRYFVFLVLLFGMSVYVTWRSETQMTVSDVARYEVTRSALQPQQLRYVTLCSARLNGIHRTGNHLFLLSALIYAAHVTSRDVAMPAVGWLLDDVFVLDNIHRYHQSGPECPCHEFYTRPNFYHGDYRLDTDEGRRAMLQDESRTLAFCGLYQTYRYADAISQKLRHLLRFRSIHLDTARQILEQSRPPSWERGSYGVVGLHVRRGDFLARYWSQYGLTVVDRRYVNHAVDYFTAKYRRVQLVVTSNDPRWISDVLVEKFAPVSVHTSSKYISMTSTAGHNTVVVMLSRNQTVGVDLALLTSCDGVIVSTGSFGWWAAWLANRTTVYYDRWSRVGSAFSRQFDPLRYFPSHWIPMR